MSFDGTFDPLALTRTDTIGSVTSVKNSSTGVQKSSKASTGYPRIDLEPLYTELKDAIGHRWDVYFEAITRFTRGELHAHEFGDLCDEILYGSDNILLLHNRFVCAIAFNAARESPEPGIAAWVTAATDKTASGAGKTVATSDAAEQRLKKEVMAIPARDRRRLKTTTAEEEQLRVTQYEESYQASQIKVPEAASSTNASLTKTNWEPEIKKRYQQPLFTETSEFPDIANVYARMIPICYEEAVPQGSSTQCAELVVASAGAFLKDFVSNVFDRVKSNGPKFDSGVGGGISTSSYVKQTHKQQELYKAGKLRLSREDGLLPIESEVAKHRSPLTLEEFKLANRTGPCLWSRQPLLDFSLTSKPDDIESQEQRQYRSEYAERTDDEMSVDDQDFNWETEGYGGRGALDSLLSDCLAMPA